MCQDTQAPQYLDTLYYYCSYCSTGTALKARPAHRRLQRLCVGGGERQSGSICRGRTWALHWSGGCCRRLHCPCAYLSTRAMLDGKSFRCACLEDMRAIAAQTALCAAARRQG